MPINKVNCDNTEHKTDNTPIEWCLMWNITLRVEFDKDECVWCQECLTRDIHMVHKAERR